MVVEKATLEELDRICCIDSKVIGNQSRRDYLLKSIENNECLLTRINADLVGFTVYDHSFFGYCFIKLVIVDPQFRRRGVAKAMIQYIEKNAPTTKLFTSTNESNVTMQKVCESLGFAKSGVIENIDEGDPELVYFKQLFS